MLNSNFYIKCILDALFVAEYRRLGKDIDKLSQANQEAQGLRLDGFMFMGKFYRHSSAAIGGGDRRTLDLSLWPRMYSHLADRKNIDDDQAGIKQILFRLLEPWAQPEEIRDAVPDCIADALPFEISLLPRTREIESMLRTERDQRQFARIMPRIEFYSAARLIY